MSPSQRRAPLEGRRAGPQQRRGATETPPEASRAVENGCCTPKDGREPLQKRGKSRAQGGKPLQGWPGSPEGLELRAWKVPGGPGWVVAEGLLAQAVCPGGYWLDVARACFI